MRHILRALCVYVLFSRVICFKLKLVHQCRVFFDLEKVLWVSRGPTNAEKGLVCTVKKASPHLLVRARIAKTVTLVFRQGFDPCHLAPAPGRNVTRRSLQINVQSGRFRFTNAVRT